MSAIRAKKKIAKKQTTRQWLTQPDVCARLGVSPKTVQRYRKSGALKFARLGYKTIRFRVEDVEAFERKGLA